MIGTLEPFLLGAIGAVIPVALGAYFVRRKTKAETADIITEAAGRLVEHLERRILDLERRLEAAETRERAAQMRIGVLTVELDQLRDHINTLDMAARRHVDVEVRIKDDDPKGQR